MLLHLLGIDLYIFPLYILFPIEPKVELLSCFDLLQRGPVCASRPRNILFDNEGVPEEDSLRYKNIHEQTNNWKLKPETT